MRCKVNGVVFLKGMLSSRIKHWGILLTRTVLVFIEDRKYEANLYCLPLSRNIIFIFISYHSRDRSSLFSNQFMRNRIWVDHFWEPLPVLCFSTVQALTWNLSWGINNVAVFVPLWSHIIFRRFVHRNRIRDLCDHWKWCR